MTLEVECYVVSMEYEDFEVVWEETEFYPIEFVYAVVKYNNKGAIKS